MNMQQFEQHALTLNLKVRGYDKGQLMYLPNRTTEYKSGATFRTATATYEGNIVIEYNVDDTSDNVNVCWWSCDRSYVSKISFERFLKMTLTDVEEIVGVIMHNDEKYQQAMKIAKQMMTDTKITIKNLLK